jgi:hypothetical protein
VNQPPTLVVGQDVIGSDQSHLFSSELYSGHYDALLPAEEKERLGTSDEVCFYGQPLSPPPPPKSSKQQSLVHVLLSSPLSYFKRICLFGTFKLSDIGYF